MKASIISFILTFILIHFSLSAQQQDTRSQEFRKKRASIMELFKTDPEAARDSMRAMNLREKKREAQRRLERYRLNDRIDTLHRIDLRNAGLSEIPAFVFRAHELKRLYIGGNSIEKLPKELSALDSLKRIYWNETDFDRRPKIPKLPQVEQFFFSNNALKFRRRFWIFGEVIPLLPRVIKFKNLEYLALANDSLNKAPIRTLKKNDKLKVLILNRNPITATEQEWEKLQGLKVLNINKAGLAYFDPAIYNLTSLEELQLLENDITVIPEGISGLKNLKKLSFYKNEIEQLPPDRKSVV